MKKLIVMILLISACSVFADITIVQKVQTGEMMGQPPQNITVTLYIKGNRARIEGIGENASIYQIIDLNQRKMWIVDNNKRTVAVVSSEMMDKAQESIEKMGKTTKTDIQKTGKSDTVNGYKCDEYTINTTGGILNMNSTQCVTNDVKADEFEPFRKYAESYVKMMGNVSTPKGVPVRTNAKVSLMGQTFESKAEVQSISRAKIAESRFEIPPDYKVVGMPQSQEGAKQ